MFYNIGGEKGEILSRCAFAIMIKTNSLWKDIEDMVHNIRMTADAIEDEDGDQYEVLYDELKDLDSFDNIIQKWEMANKMRKWYKDKLSLISNKASTMFSSESDRNDYIKKEIDSVFQAIIDKSEFLLKLATPNWNMKQSSTIIEDHNSLLEKTESLAKEKSILMRLITIRKIQSSEVIADNYNNTDDIEIYNSSLTSVLAFLQNSVKVGEIKIEVESNFVNTIMRYCGLKILDLILDLEIDQETFYSTLNWFSSSLRNNSNLLTHYSTDLTGSGSQIQAKLSRAFFSIFDKIVKELHHTTHKNKFLFLINCLQWEIKTRDHENYIKSNIFETLKNGKSEPSLIFFYLGHLCKKNWAGSLYDSNHNKTITHKLVTTLMNMTVSCISQILIREDEHTKKVGAQSLNLQTALSVMNTDITGQYMINCLDIIFSNLNNHLDALEYKAALKLEKEANEEIKSKDIKEEDTKEDHNKLEEAPKLKKLNTTIFHKSSLKPTPKSKKNQKEYDTETINRLLKLIEIFTKVSYINKDIKTIVKRITTSANVKTLIKLVNVDNIWTKFGIFIILMNLIDSDVDHEIFTQSIKDLKTYKISNCVKGEEIEIGQISQKLADYNLISDFSDFPFLNFLFYELAAIRSTIWKKGKEVNEHEYIISCTIINLLIDILRKSSQEQWKNKLESTLDEFVADSGKYSDLEFDILISLLEGGEYRGLHVGSNCLTKEGIK